MCSLLIHWGVSSRSKKIKRERIFKCLDNISTKTDGWNFSELNTLIIFPLVIS